MPTTTSVPAAVGICPKWCVLHGEDTCYGPDHTVALPLLGPAEWRYAYALLNRLTGEIGVSFGSNDEFGDIFTPAEAREMATGLVDELPQVTDETVITREEIRKVAAAILAAAEEAEAVECFS